MSDLRVSDFDRKWERWFRISFASMPVAWVLGLSAGLALGWLGYFEVAFFVGFGIAIAPAFACVALLWFDIMFNPRWRR